MPPIKIRYNGISWFFLWYLFWLTSVAIWELNVIPKMTLPYSCELFQTLPYCSILFQDGINDQWEFQDPKMEVLYHIRPYFVGIFPYIGLKNRPNIYGIGTSVLNRFLASMAIEMMGESSLPWSIPSDGDLRSNTREPLTPVWSVYFSTPRCWRWAQAADPLRDGSQPRTRKDPLTLRAGQHNKQQSVKCLVI